ncbi:MAG: hypothetical protein J7647_32750 [Cyanobacteria bacterium SBLK]|nr:hypothetical protein [Cyanobacteria bacterium SBLK]
MTETNTPQTLVTEGLEDIENFRKQTELLNILLETLRTPTPPSKEKKETDKILLRVEVLADSLRCFCEAHVDSMQNRLNDLKECLQTERSRSLDPEEEL